MTVWCSGYPDNHINDAHARVGLMLTVTFRPAVIRLTALVTDRLPPRNLRFVRTMSEEREDLMAEEFRADYEQLERIASLFESHADTVATVMREMQAQYDELIGQGNWIGRGSQAFAQEMTDLIFPAIVRLQDALREARSVTEQIAQITQDAEDEASARFDRR